ncbi:MAG: hypothetical protein DRI90_22165, partial [Deltaproteobacteria bacterium]
MHSLTFSAFAIMTAFSVAGLINCGGDDETSNGGTGGSGLTGGSGGSTGGGGGSAQCTLTDAGDDCNALASASTPITQTDSTDSLPTGTGGEIANGVYYTTGITAYAGSPALGAGIVMEQTWEICDGVGHL